MSNRIHVLIDGEQFGPYPEVEFRQHLADRKILRSDPVWREGLADWVSAEKLLGMLDLGRQHAAPAPATVESIVARTKSAAEQGDAEAQFQLGLIFEKGDGVAPLDLAKAVKWFRKAAQQGHAAAQFHLSLALIAGKGVASSDAEALQWLHAAAESDLAEAQYLLGRKLAN